MDLTWRLKALGRRARARLLDRHGDTTTAVPLDQLGLDRAGYHDYEPSGWRFVARALEGLPLGPEDVFVDVGCGKGRVLAQAARRPFRRVIGVELSSELAEQARHVTDRQRRSRRCGELEIVVADATTWPVPDEVTVVYVYNALSGAPFRAMLDRVAESAPRAPRPRWLLYANPEFEHEVAGHPAFELHERRGDPGWRAADPRWISVYRVRSTTPAAQSSSRS